MNNGSRMCLTIKSITIVNLKEKGRGVLVYGCYKRAAGALETELEQVSVSFSECFPGRHYAAAVTGLTFIQMRHMLSEFHFHVGRLSRSNCKLP